MKNSTVSGWQIQPPLSVQDQIEFFEMFLEHETELFDRTIEDFHYWPFIRFHVYDLLLQSKGWIKKQDRRKSATLFDMIGIVGSLIYHSFYWNWRRHSKTFDVLVLNVVGNTKRGRFFYDRYTDILLRQFPFSYTVWENPSLWRHSLREPNSHICYFDSLHLEKRLISLLSRRGFQKALMKSEAVKIAQWAMRLGCRVDVNKIIFLLNLTFLYKIHYTSTIENRLKRTGVRCVVMVTHYDPLKMLITTIAKRLGIYVIELQHGTMGRYHPAYNLGYKKPLQTLPDEILTFGSFWKEHSRFSENQLKLTTTGFPYYEIQVKKYVGNTAVRRGNRTRLLVISQDIIAYALDDLTVQLSQILDMNQFEIWFKMHPREYQNWTETYSDAFQKAPIRVCCKENIYDLLFHSDVHIGVYSTAIVESLVFNKMLIILESYGIHFIYDLIQCGRAYLAKTPEEVAHFVQEVELDSGRREAAKDYWEFDSQKKIIKRINEIIKRT